MIRDARNAVSDHEDPSLDGDGGVAWAAVALVAGCGALAGLIESMLIPLYAGTFLVPLAPLLAVLSNVALPILARRAVDRTGAAALPFLAWLVVVIALSSVPRSEGDVIFPGGTYLQWQSYGVVFGGTLAGAITLMRMATLSAPRTGR
jgi:hypothetical protein